MNMPELKPCPFCGGAGNIHHINIHHIAGCNVYIVQCTNCGCVFSTWFPSSDAAKSAWNRRVSDD